MLYASCFAFAGQDKVVVRVFMNINETGRDDVVFCIDYFCRRIDLPIRTIRSPTMAISVLGMALPVSWS